jgi:uncharacterized protein YjbJ (UPF0337 family)
MERLFQNAMSFNNPLVWDSSSVTTMTKMFFDASAFNAELVLDTTNVMSMALMFRYSAFDVDISAWNVASVTNFHTMFYGAPFSHVLCWDLDFSEYINLDEIFSDDDASATAWIDPDAAKCACGAGEYYDGAACVACESGTTSQGKTESCVSCRDLLCPPSPSPTNTAMPTVTPAPTSSPKPSAEPTLVPTANPTMTRITEISSTYVSSSTLYAEEIYLNGVAFSQASRRLESTKDMVSGEVEKMRVEMETMMTLIKKLEAHASRRLESSKDMVSDEVEKMRVEMETMMTLIKKLEANSEEMVAADKFHRTKIQELETRLRVKVTDK